MYFPWHKWDPSSAEVKHLSSLLYCKNGLVYAKNIFLDWALGAACSKDFACCSQIQPKHLSCVGLCCFYIAVKSSEEEKNVPLANDLIRISQNRFTVSDMMRMEKIIMEKLYWKVKAPTAHRFLHLFHSHVQEQLSSERY